MLINIQLLLVIATQNVKSANRIGSRMACFSVPPWPKDTVSQPAGAEGTSRKFAGFPGNENPNLAKVPYVKQVSYYFPCLFSANLLIKTLNQMPEIRHENPLLHLPTPTATAPPYTVSKVPVRWVLYLWKSAFVILWCGGGRVEGVVVNYLGYTCNGT